MSGHRGASFTRRVTTAMAVVSLLLAVLAGWMWRRSYVEGDLFTWGNRLAVETSQGQLQIERVGSEPVAWTQVEHTKGKYATSTFHARNFRPDLWLDNNQDWSLWGFAKYSGAGVNPADFEGGDFTDATWARYPVYTVPHWVLVMPIWPFFALCCLPPALWLLAHRPRRARPGFCRQCGYDLRAHAAGEKCPECGTVVPSGRVRQA